MTTIPDHPVEVCSATEYRLGPFNIINENNILRGDKEVVLERLRGFKNGEFLCREYQYYKNRDSCIMCFWKLLFHSLPYKLSGLTNEELKSIYYYEIVGHQETIVEDNCLKRIVKQKTEPFTEWAYSISEDSEKEDYCIIRFICKTESGKRPKTRTFERCFPDGTQIRAKLQCSLDMVLNILDNAEQKEGKWLDKE